MSRRGSVYRYLTLIVCERCYAEHVIDYSGLSIEHGGKCELCGDMGYFRLIQANSRRRRNESGEEKSLLG